MTQATLEINLKGREFVLQTGDITKVPADAIVNAANAALSGGGGVDGAIHRAGGPSIMADLDVVRSKIGRCPPGDAVFTGAGRLPARWVIHAVGPVYRGGRHQEAETLASCYRRCLELADKLGAVSLTLPAISTGAYRYPLYEAAQVAVETVAGALTASGSQVQRVSFVLFGDDVFQAFKRAVLRLWPQAG